MPRDKVLDADWREVFPSASHTGEPNRVRGEHPSGGQALPPLGAIDLDLKVLDPMGTRGMDPQSRCRERQLAKASSSSLQRQILFGASPRSGRHCCVGRNRQDRGAARDAQEARPRYT